MNPCNSYAKVRRITYLHFKKIFLNVLPFTPFWILIRCVSNQVCLVCMVLTICPDIHRIKLTLFLSFITFFPFLTQFHLFRSKRIINFQWRNFTTIIEKVVKKTSVIEWRLYSKQNVHFKEQHVDMNESGLII